jgi:rRNA-processing protein EBP2
MKRKLEQEESDLDSDLGSDLGSELDSELTEGSGNELLDIQLSEDDIAASDDGDMSDASDKELQVAFASGLVKPGLNIQKVKKEFVNDRVGLKQALDDMKQNFPWIERMEITIPPLAPPPPFRDQLGADPDDLTGEEVHNDFKREMKFHRLGQATVLEGIARLNTMGIPTRRPEDYFAEMAKSDAHMQKIRKKLLSKQLAAEHSEKAKKLREQRKYGKKVQQEVLQARQKEKKEMLAAVKKHRKKGGGDLSFLENGKNKNDSKNNKANPKREFKNKKYGFGGQKKRSKLNTRDSAKDMSDFSGVKHSNMKAKKGMPKGGNKNRPGKGRRRAQKNKRK